ncbi:MAG: hypothetical protein HKN87_18045 [Saprospiraceae bacterium]|nr:hypothetical protein [Saprospiraceae bacterium]
MYVLLLLGTILIAGNQSDGWQVLKPEQGHFQILAPGKMRSSVREIQTDIGKVDYHSLLHQRLDDSTVTFTFIVSYYKLNEATIAAMDNALEADLLKATVLQSAHAIGGDVILEDDITYQGLHPGKYWRIHTTGDELVIKSRAYLSDEYFYSIQVAVHKAQALSPDIDRFLDSFRILES